jgi:hypothetical protein
MRHTTEEEAKADGRWLAKLGRRPAIIVLAAMGVAGLFLAAVAALAGQGAANAIAPLIGGLAVVAFASRHQARDRPPRSRVKLQLALIVLGCVTIVVIILIAVPGRG